VQAVSISVIIPTWNRADTVVRAIQSVLAQTLPPLEVLVCDDGSTDDTEARVRALGDVRVKWVTGPRAGRPAIPRNRGIASAKGDWLAFLDSDDFWLPEKLEKQIKSVLASRNLASCSDAWRIVPGEEGRRPLLGGEDRALTFDSLILDNRVICSSACIHRSLIAKIEGFPEAANLRAVEDFALWLRILQLTHFDYISEPLLNYTDDPKHSIRKYDVGPWQQRIIVLCNLTCWLLRTRPKAWGNSFLTTQKQLILACAKNAALFFLKRRA